VLCSFGVSWLRSSRLGSAMLAVRADERSAAAAGIDVVKTKLVGFAISAFIAGIGGSLLAYQLGTVTFDSFDAYVGLIFFSIVVVAGMTSVSGALVAGLLGSGGILFTWLSATFKIGNWYGIIAGLGVVLTVIKNPDGLVGPVHAQLEKARLRKIRQRVGQKFVLDATAPLSPIDRLASVNREGSSLLDVQDLTVRYGGVVAVDHVSFSVRQGQIVGLIGPNGAGKTTTIDALCGFHPYDGTVHLDGNDMAGDAPHKRASRGLGRTFQLAGVSDDLTVEENTALGQRRAARGDRKPLDDLFELLGLSDLRELHVAELSQGQRQLVSVARALAGEPRLLLLDEPAAGLDSTESGWLCERLRHVRDRGATILLIEHDMSLVLGLCDEIHVLDFGGLIASGSPVEIRNNELVTAAYDGDRSKKVV
jgi:ABC-type branched-subunit amino acid transport system ATPase component